MKKLIIAAFVAVVPFAAHAADLPAKKDAPVPVAVKEPNTFWQSGFYGGFSLGTGYSESEIQFKDGGWENDSAYPTARGKQFAFIGGLDLGYNLVNGSTLVGVETDLNYMNFSAMHEDNPYSDAKVGQEVVGLSTIRLRAGYLFDQTLVYATGGFAMTAGNVIQNDDVTDKSQNNNDTSELVFSPGWTAGVGVEHAFSSKWSVKAEYLYLQTYGQAHTYYPAENEEYRTFQTFTSNIVRVGLNYKF